MAEAQERRVCQEDQAAQEGRQGRDDRPRPGLEQLDKELDDDLRKHCAQCTPAGLSCTPLLRAGGRSLSVRDRARECLVMSCAENGGSIPTHVGAVSRRVREEAGGVRTISTVFLVVGSRGRIHSVNQCHSHTRTHGQEFF
jgi:hypothetical protein